MVSVCGTQNFDLQSTHFHTSGKNNCSIGLDETTLRATFIECVCKQKYIVNILHTFHHHCDNITYVYNRNNEENY